MQRCGSDDLFGEEGSDSLNSVDGVEGNHALDGGTGTDTCSTDPIEESIASCEQHRRQTQSIEPGL